MITLLLFLQVHFELLGEAGVKGLYNCETIVKTLQFAVEIYIHIEFFKQNKCNSYFYVSGQSQPFLAALKLL